MKVGFGPLKWGEIAFPFAKKSEKLEDINKALKELEQDGTLSEISTKWLKVDATKNKIKVCSLNVAIVHQLI